MADSPDAPTPADEQPAFAAGWYADPLGRAELRYYDGSAWTDHVSTGGVQTTDPVEPSPPPAERAPTSTPPATPDEARQAVRQQTEGLGDYLVSGSNAAKFAGVTAAWQGTGHLLTEPVLVVQQHTSFIETAAHYDVAIPDGTVVGSVRQVGQSQAKQLVRAFTNFDKYMSHTFEMLDAQGQLLMRLTRPPKVRKSRLVVEAPDGREIGQIAQQNTFGKVRFALEAGGQTLGSINGKNWRDYNFTIEDAAGQEIGVIAKSWQGLAKAVLGGGDHFVVAMHRPLDDPLRMLVVASGVCIDTALHQEA